jgi:hypothetical protein
VILQAVDGIVGGAHQRHVHLPHDPAAGELVLRQLGPRLFPDALGRLERKQPMGDAQRTPQLHVRPMIQGIAERGRDRLGPFLELIPVRRIAGAITFGHAVGAHRPPLVMVAVKPSLREVFELVILGDLLRRQVAVVVDDRHVPSVLVVQRHRPVGLQQEILRDEDVLHGAPFP